MSMWFQLKVISFQVSKPGFSLWHNELLLIPSIITMLGDSIAMCMPPQVEDKVKICESVGPSSDDWYNLFRNQPSGGGANRQ